ncbi:hypothetical protein [Kaarinaea lacus]
MKLWPVLTVLLLFALILSNTIWIYTGIDSAVTDGYENQLLYERTETLKSLLSLTPKLTQGKTKSEIVAIAESTIGEQSFQKDGITWIGWLGLKFDQQGQLTEITPTWSYGNEFPL